MKIFVTGDNHIGLKYVSHNEREKLASERIDALTRSVAEANKEDCELFAITGDLFDNGNVAEKSVKAVVEALGEFKGIVAVLPGNHDHYDDNAKIWKNFRKYSAEKDNIVLLSEYKPYCFDEINAVIYPAFCDKLHSADGENKLGWIKSADLSDVGKIIIGMAHGTVDGEALDNEGKYFLMTRRELNEIPVDVWLTGHAHVPFPNDLTAEFAASDEKIFNPGTHVQTNVNNNTEGLCFILEINDEKKISAKKFVSGGIRFYRKGVVVSAGNMEAEISETVKELGDNSVVELTLEGAVTEDEYKNRAEIVEGALKRFLEGTYNDDGVSRLITKEYIEQEFPIEASFARGFLNDLLDDPKEAQLAFELIQKVKEENK